MLRLIACVCGMAGLLVVVTDVWGEEAVSFSPKSLAYVLQADRLSKDRADTVQKLARCGRDLIVLDQGYNTDSDGPWRPEEIETIRAGHANRKVVAYLSIGEAEDYRPYWRKEWDANRDGKPDAGAPAYLLTVNPDWAGNYRLRYWHADWQKIMLAAVDVIVAQGFDGVYLDIVDGFEFFEYDPATMDWLDDRKNPETKNTYRRDMIQWVQAIAARARKKRPEMLVIPQNGAQLLVHDDYRAVISGIGVEDLLVSGKKLVSEKKAAYLNGFLDRLKPSHKPVFVIEYPKGDEVKPLAAQAAKERGYVLLMTDRQLTTLGESNPP